MVIAIISGEFVTVTTQSISQYHDLQVYYRHYTQCITLLLTSDGTKLASGTLVCLEEKG